MVNESERFRFLDDLSILEIVNLLTVGLSSFNLKQQVPNDIATHNQFISCHNLKSQEWLDNICEWTDNQKMKINSKKTKTMIFNFTDKYQFGTRLSMENENLEVIDSTRLLGTIITNDLKWEQNTAQIVKKSNARMELLRREASFGTSTEDLKTIYYLFVRSQLEQSSVVWHSSLTEENKTDLERVQKSAVKIIMGDNYKSYNKSLQYLDMETLDERRESLCLKFAQRCLKNEKTRMMFPLNEKNHGMETRNMDKFRVEHANTDRLKNFAQIYMQNLLNQHEKTKI